MKETANRYTIALLSVVVVLALAAFIAPASAWPGALPLDRTIAGDPGNSSNIMENVTVANGTFTVEWYKDDGSPNGCFDFDVPDKNLNWIGIYHSVWTSNSCISQSFTYNSHSLGTLQFGDSDSSTCDQNDNTRSTGLGTCGVWFDDETANTTKGAANRFRSWGGSSTFHGTAMPMVFNDSSDQGTLHHWFNQGYDDSIGYGSGSGYSHVMNYSICNVTRNLSTDWTLLVAVTCADDGIIKINGNTLTNGFPATTKYYHVAINDIDQSWLNATTNGTNYVELCTNDEYFHPFWVWLVDAKQWTDISVTDIYGTPRPNTNSTVNATITNSGGVDVGHFNVSLYVDNVLNETVNVTAGLSKGASTTVSFTKVNESKGCQSFKVFADSDNVITEPNKLNNNMTKNIQVGYVIVVESDSDFEKLNTSGSSALPSGCFKNESGTYYIQNMTGSYSIENCNGNGITIENTNKKFVIRNCTIKNCTYSGVKFHNLSYGTIDNSTVSNNTEYGIEVGEVPLDDDDPNYVNITCNTINETRTDVLLIVYNATVISNTILNNTEYAIYLYGNDSNITCNMLEGNTGYAIKAYNSSRNNIYCNTFIDNNAGSPGHQAWDNGNSNNWNSTELSKNYIGNRWKDWQNNSGYPCNYTIDGGSNVDKRPRGLYDFLTGAGVDKWAFKWQLTQAQFNSGSPIYPDTEFNATEYAAIKADDGVFACNTTTDDGYYAAHRFNFSINDSCTCTCINESALEMSVINVTWNGIGKHDSATATDGAKLYIYNFTLAAYEQLNSTILSTEVTLTGGVVVTTSSDYVNSGNVTILVNQTSPQTTGLGTDYSHIETDYVKLVVTPDP